MRHPKKPTVHLADDHSHQPSSQGERVSPGKVSPVQRRYTGVAPGRTEQPEVSADYVRSLHFGNPVQRAASGGPAAGDVAGKLNSGSPLPEATRAKMEDHFGTPLSGVKVHTDSTAAVLCAQMGARAFTTGQDIAFAQGEFKPQTPAGDGLIAHELTHTIQQKAGRATQLSGLGGDAGTRDSLEAEAEHHERALQRKSAMGADGGSLEAEANANEEAIMRKADAEAEGTANGAAEGNSSAEAGGSEEEQEKLRDPRAKIANWEIIPVAGEGAVAGGTSDRDAGAQSADTGGAAEQAALQKSEVIQQDGPPNAIDILGGIVNTAQAAWDIIKDNRPQATAQTKFCQAVPANVPWQQLYGWQTRSSTFRFKARNGFGVTVYDCRFTLSRQWNGRTSAAAGQFLNNFTIYSNSASVAWGYTVDANASVSGNAFNSGTAQHPVGAIPLFFSFTVSTPFWSESNGTLYTAHGHRQLDAA
ncbi:MAG: DUF4157 domain-containing protein [Proteobacteria bacterium]|nr:DUF4157 domain-containing protein [Pseudomonadota bacterium]